jgi:hypothetical protein
MAAKPSKQASPAKTPTADQRRAHAEMRLLSAAWNDLTDEQRQAWATYSRHDRRGGRAARSRQRSGRRSFCKANFHLLALGQPLLADPPAKGSYCPAPLLKLFIPNRAGRIALKLRVLQGSTEGVMLSSWHPCSRGTMVWKKFARIGLTPPPKAGISDITRLYVDKFGWPRVGTKIFLRVQQMKDLMGSLSYTISAIVQAEDGWAKSSKVP